MYISSWFISSSTGPPTDMAPTLKIWSILQLLALIYCIRAADIKTADQADDISEDIKTAEDGDDLDTAATGWLVMDPIQKKLREIEYVKTKLLSPFMTLKSPMINYGGGYPVYSTSGSSGFSVGGNYPKYAGSQPYYWNKPMKMVAPFFSQNSLYNKGSSGSNFQQVNPIPTYAPNCDDWKPIAVSVPSKPTYSVGTPLNSYHSSAGPNQVYGTPLINYSAKATISSTSSQSGSAVPSSQAISVPVLISDTIVLKSSDPRQFQGYQNVNPASYWSSTGSLPSVPSWSSTSGSVPSQVSSFSSNNAWSSASGYNPFSSGAPQVPAAISNSPYWTGTSGYYPVPLSGSQVSSYVPTTPSPLPAWSTVEPSSQQSTQTSSIPLSSYFSQGSQYSTPSPIAQQYFVVPPTPTSASTSDQGEVRITPPPAQVKSNFVSTPSGPSVVVPVDSSVYSPGNSYYGSYYPNVFYITNEQHVDKPDSTETPDQERSSLQLSSGDTSTSTEKTSTSTDSSSISTKTLSTPQVSTSPVQTTFYSSLPGNQQKFAIYSLPPPAISPNGFYSSPVQGSYPIPVSSSLLGTSSVGVSQPSSSQFFPASRTRTLVNSYPIPLGYRYNVPSIAFQSGFQSQLTAKVSPPC